MSEERRPKIIEQFRIGDILLSRRPDSPGKIWLVRVDGPAKDEGGSFSEEDFEEWIELFYRLHF